MAGKAGHTHLVLRIRLVLAALLATAVLTPALYQPLLTGLWELLRRNAAYRASTFETFWTVFCYAAIEVPITVVFVKHPEWRYSPPQGPTPRQVPKGMRRPSRRWLEGLTYVAPLLLLDLVMIKKFGGVTREAQLVSGNYDPDLASPYHRANFLMPSLHNFTWSSPLQTQRALPADAPSSRRLALELITSLVIYDAGFFTFHLAMHVLPLVSAWHAPHHRHGAMHPQLTNQLHVAERLGLVMLANFALNIIGAHVLTRTLFVPLFVWLLVEIHCGMDLPWAYDKVLPAGWGGGARKHALHHVSGQGGLAPYFEWCDVAYRWVASRLVE